MTSADKRAFVDQIVADNRVVIFSKSYCPFCHRVKDLFKSLNVEYNALELDLMGEEGNAIQAALIEKTNQKTVPNVFINANHVGGCDSTLQAHADGKLFDLLQNTAREYDYDLLIIGGGSGGLAASKEAALLGKKVAVCDFVKPSPQGTTWGLGGTCVNVGCIPKKLMHRAALTGHTLQDGTYFGWMLPDEVHHNWEKMVEEVQNYVKSLNFGYRKVLREKSVTYLNAYAQFVDSDPHKVVLTDKKNVKKEITAQNIIIAVGGRPRYPQIPGAVEYGITSDDLFSLPYRPGKTLIVGASYIALECAGFLAGFGIEVTVMVRSIFLRGFDQQMAEMIGEHMEKHGVQFIKGCVPLQIERIEEPSSPNAPGLLRVTAKMNNGEQITTEFNTVLFAVGRDACTGDLGLDKVGVEVNKSNGKIIANESEQTSVRNIFAIGDVLDGKLELTPVAIQAGRLLAQRLYGQQKVLTDYTNVPTTVFTPLEYGCVGLSEEDAKNKYGEDDIEVYHSYFQPLEYVLSNRDPNVCYAKLICVKSDGERVVGFHVLSPDAGEITQGFAIGLKLAAKKADFDNLIGIHPTCAEIFTTLKISKASGLSVEKTGC
ncbi:Thioredoxin reductase 1, mitochondrial [Gryllus bimaculatus]|nr:Thioredoxin reductase 1, mitochondrial [Gryllus bimaculatus]